MTRAAHRSCEIFEFETSAGRYFGWQFESNKLQPARVSCSVHLASRGKKSLEIFQNVSSVTSIFWRKVCEFLRGWATEQLPRLLVRMKEAVPFLQGVGDQQIVISYKDLSLPTFINIDRNYRLHVSEAFRDASPHSPERGKRGKQVNKATRQPSFLVFEHGINSEIASDRRLWLKTSKGNQLSQKLQSQDMQ